MMTKKTLDKLDRPAIYVGTYHKYASGSIAGAWIYPGDYDSYEELKNDRLLFISFVFFHGFSQGVFYNGVAGNAFSPLGFEKGNYIGIGFTHEANGKDIFVFLVPFVGVFLVSAHDTSISRV